MKLPRLPSNWKKQRLSELVAKFDAGISVNGGDRPAIGDECGVLKISAVTEGQFRPNENKVIDGSERERACLNPRRDSLIMSRANTPELVGASAYIDRDYPNLYLSDKLWQFVPHKEKVFSMRWLGFVLASHAYRKKLGEVATGSSQSMKNISQGSVLQMELPVPPLTEQQHMAKLLGMWDSAIEKTERLITAKESSQRGWMQELVMDRLFPEHRLSEFVYRVNRKNTTGNGHPLTISGRDGLISQSHYFDKRIAAEVTEQYTLLKRGEFAYNKSYSAGYPYGAIKRLDDYDEGIVSSLYLGFALNSDAPLLSDYLMHFCEVGGFNHQIHKIAQEGARNHGLLNVAAHDFFAIKLPVPPIAEQLRVVEILGDAGRELVLLRKSLDYLRQQKRGLMQKLLTGQWRVPIPATKEV